MLNLRAVDHRLNCSGYKSVDTRAYPEEGKVIVLAASFDEAVLDQVLEAMDKRRKKVSL